MTPNELYDSLVHEIHNALVNMDIDAVPDLVNRALGNGEGILQIIDSLSKGIYMVADKYKTMDCYLPQLIMAVDAMEQAMVSLHPQMDRLNLIVGSGGTIVTAQIQGDAHGIWRNIASALLRVSGFTVFDLGSDMRLDGIIDKALELKADAIALWLHLKTSLPYGKDLLKLLDERSLSGKFKVVICGSPVTPDYVKLIGADGCAKDALEAVRLIGDLLMGGK